MSASRKQKHEDDPATRASINEDVRTRGVAAVARDLGLSRDATLAIAAGAPVRAGTLAQARERLAIVKLAAHP